MALATEDDVETALGRSLTSAEDVTGLLDEASDLVIGYLGAAPDPVPGAVSRAVATMVAAVLTKPATTVADYNEGGANTLGYNTGRETATVRVGVESATTRGPWLTAALKMRLRPYRSAATRRVFSINIAPDSEAPESNGVDDL